MRSFQVWLFAPESAVSGIWLQVTGEPLLEALKSGGRSEWRPAWFRLGQHQACGFRWQQPSSLAASRAPVPLHPLCMALKDLLHLPLHWMKFHNLSPAGSHQELPNPPPPSSGEGVLPGRAWCILSLPRHLLHQPVVPVLLFPLPGSRLPECLAAGAGFSRLLRPVAMSAAARAGDGSPRPVSGLRGL